ncbi:MAG: nitronate monooxygenase [Chloroflexi bacterium]|nr:nitronate monooxygenase [Chloroflexota bacterium]
MNIRTDFTEMLGIDVPIVGAPMFLVSYEEYVIALSEAGALGTFPLPNYRTTADLKQALQTIRQATGRPIGVNIHLSGRFPWKEQLGICLDAGVSFYISSLGNPALILDDVHANGGIVFADVISLAQGLKAREHGVDGLIAVAAGAGGHCGMLPTLIFTPYLRQHTGLPVIAAGGISTGAQLAAALAVGACAAIVGTRLIATHEARAAPAYKQAVIVAHPEDIVISNEITGTPATWLSSSIADFDEQPAPQSKRWRDLWSAGLSVAQIDQIKPVGEVIEEMVQTYTQTCQHLSQTIHP